MRKTRRYAQDTEVSVAKSRAEIDDLLQSYGATATAVFQDQNQASIAFKMKDRNVRFDLRLPSIEDKSIVWAKCGAHGKRRRSPEERRTAHEKACRRLWRSLVLAIKAKLVAVEDGVENFEEAFLSHIIMPDGKTVGEHTQPRIAQAYQNHESVPLLPRQ